MSIARSSLLFERSRKLRLRSPHIHRGLGGGIGACAERSPGFLHNINMSSDDPQTSTPPAVTVEPAETAATPVATDLLAPLQTTPPSLAEPEMLVKGLRYLQERIPEFTQLSVREKRSHARAANLDPEFVENGLHAARVWRQTKMMVKRTGEELGEEQEEIRRWDEVIREMRALTDGIEAANVKRKHRLGTAILHIYRMLGIYLDRSVPEEAYMRASSKKEFEKDESPASAPAAPPGRAERS